MPLGTNNTTKTTADKFIPEVWEDGVVAGYKSNLVMGNLVTKINHKGKKGDVIYMPKPVRGSASSKTASNQVTLVAPTHEQLTFNIDKHYEYSTLIEDIVSVQAFNTLRSFHTDDAGYALAKQVDDDLHALGAGLQGGSAYSAAVIGGDGTTVWDGSASTNTGNGSTLTDAGIRKMIQTLDDADVPMMGRVMVIPPVEKNTLTGIARFTEQAFVGEVGPGNTIRNGRIGEIYGMEVFVSTNCPTIQADDASTNYRVGMIFHKEAFVFIEQLGVRTQSQYKQEYLADLFTADTIYGVGEMRDTAGIAFVVPE
ncbi:MAG: phage major capsid protein [Candidatus Thorarchaeota archaeon]|jgi:N4-gp56 family major capsid protein